MRRVSLSVAALALLLISLSSVHAQTVRSFFVEASATGSHKPVVKGIHEVKTIDVVMPKLKIKQTGLLTSRLSDKDRVRWKVIEQLALATDANGAPVHPVLNELLHWADNCGHLIYLELDEPRITQSSIAGSFKLERFDPAGRHHIAVLKLFLSKIDKAVVSPQVARTNGFVPFSDLRREERYAEVLGHELSHLKYVLNNTMRTLLVHELVETTNELVLVNARQRPLLLTSPDLRHRLQQRDTLLRELELQAEEVEEAIWHELLASRKTRAEMTTAALARRK